MAKCRRPLPPEAQRIVRALTRHLRDRLDDYRWTHEALANRLGRHRSQVSHALSHGGQEMPPQRLIQEIAVVLDAYTAEQGLSRRPLAEPTMRRWHDAKYLQRRATKRERQERRRATAAQIDGAPPASMATYQDLLDALDALVEARFGSRRALCRIHPHLGRPAVDAALGGRRSLTIELMDKILRACGVHRLDHQAWQNQWHHLGAPNQQAALERKLAGKLARRSQGRSW